MTTTHHEEHHGHHDEHEHEDHDHHDEHGHEHHHEDWNDEEYVKDWLHRQEDRLPERRKHFLLFRALITKHDDDEFRYINIGGGAGFLEEVLLEHFEAAEVTLVDGSLAMLDAARERLAKYGDRVEYVQANLAHHEWDEAVSGPYDFAVSSIAIHNLRDPRRIRELYGEIFQLIGHGGLFLNLDYVRPARPSLAELGPWVGHDEEAGLARSGGRNMPGTLQEQMIWMTEGGFPVVDVPWKNMNLAMMVGLKDHLHIPHDDDDDDHEHHHGESHGHH